MAKRSLRLWTKKVLRLWAVLRLWVVYVCGEIGFMFVGKFYVCGWFTFVGVTRCNLQATLLYANVLCKDYMSVYSWTAIWDRNIELNIDQMLQYGSDAKSKLIHFQQPVVIAWRKPIKFPQDNNCYFC